MGFLVFARAYSADKDTHPSIARLFNPDAEPWDRIKRLREDNRHVIARTDLLDAIAERRALELHYFSYVGYDTGILKGPKVALARGETPLIHPGMVRYEVPHLTRLRVAFANVLIWYYVRVEAPLAVKVVNDVAPFVKGWMFLGYPPYTPASRGALLDFVDHLTCCGERGTYYLRHVYYPHHAYMFDRSCRIGPIDQWPESTVRVPEQDTGEYRLWRYGRYLEQVLCATSDIEKLVAALENHPKLRDAVIIVHGDHGSRLTVDNPKHLEAAGYTESMRQIDQRGTFMAVRLPRKSGATVYEDLRIDAIFAALVASGFSSLDVNTIQRRPDSPYRTGLATEPSSSLAKVASEAEREHH
jgi:hypothetical protein